MTDREKFVNIARKSKHNTCVLFNTIIEDLRDNGFSYGRARKYALASFSIFLTDELGKDAEYYDKKDSANVKSIDQ
jgi:hypothetical protein